MGKFNIRVLKRSAEKRSGKLYQPGRITIGDFSDRFWMALDYWSLNTYKEQWKEAIKRIKLEESSCFVSRITQSDKELYVGAWVLYKVGNKIIFQYHFYPDEERKEQLPAFGLKTCFQHIRPWQTVKGQFEEWQISAKDFFASINTLKI